MSPRPITGWAYDPEGVGSWATSLHSTFGSIATSAPSLAESLRRAQSRWGTSRVAGVSACESWGPPSQIAGFAYVKLGPYARAEVVRSAWSLIDLGVADAVTCSVEAGTWSCGLLVERAGTAQLQLRPASNESAELIVPEMPSEGLRALVLAAFAVERGVRCVDGGEPDRARVTLAGEQWTVEVRT